MKPDELTLVDDHLRVGKSLYADAPYVMALDQMRREWEELQQRTALLERELRRAAVIKTTSYREICTICRAVADTNDTLAHAPGCVLDSSEQR